LASPEANVDSQPSPRFPKMASPQPIGATNDIQLETNEATNETNAFEYVNETNEAGITVKRRRRKKRFEKTPEAIISKVQRQASKMSIDADHPAPLVILDSNTDAWIKLKLVEWDADSSGTFSRDEVAAAMDELRDVRDTHKKLKWNIIQCLGLLLLFVGTMIGAVAVVMMATKTTEVSNGGQMKAHVKDTNQKTIIETTQAQQVGGIGDLLTYDDVTDQWLIADSQLRNLDQVSFTTKNGSFYNLDLAEIIRNDSGILGTNDQVNMLTTGGIQLKIQESIGQLEVKWLGSSMWQTVDVKGQSPSRLLGGMESESPLTESESENDIYADNGLQPPRRMFTKGGVIVVGHHRGMGHGSGGSPCSRNGYCNVPYGTAEPCRLYCQQGQCYEHKQASGKIVTYQCHHGGSQGLLTALSQFLCLATTLFMVNHNSVM